MTASFYEAGAPRLRGGVGTSPGHNQWCMAANEGVDVRVGSLCRDLHSDPLQPSDPPHHNGSFQGTTVSQSFESVGRSSAMNETAGRAVSQLSCACVVRSGRCRGPPSADSDESPRTWRCRDALPRAVIVVDFDQRALLPTCYC